MKRLLFCVLLLTTGFAYFTLENSTSEGAVLLYNRDFSQSYVDAGVNENVFLKICGEGDLDGTFTGLAYAGAGSAPLLISPALGGPFGDLLRISNALHLRPDGCYHIDVDLSPFRAFYPGNPFAVVSSDNVLNAADEFYALDGSSPDYVYLFGAFSLSKEDYSSDVDVVVEEAVDHVEVPITVDQPFLFVSTATVAGEVIDSVVTRLGVVNTLSKGGQEWVTVVVNGLSLQLPTAIVLYDECRGDESCSLSVPDDVSPKSGDAPLTMVFDGTKSFAPPGRSITGYVWDFCDPACGIVTDDASGGIALYEYLSKGAYSPTLTVFADNGGADSDSVVVTVIGTKPVADAGEDQEGTVTDTLTFDGTGSFDAQDCPAGGSCPSLSYAWDFGDLTACSKGDACCADAECARASHAYSRVGAYTVTLTVTDQDAETDEDAAVAVVYDPAAVLPDFALTEGSYSLPAEDWYNEGTYYDVIVKAYNLGAAGSAYDVQLDTSEVDGRRLDSSVAHFPAGARVSDGVVFDYAPVCSVTMLGGEVDVGDAVAEASEDNNDAVHSLRDVNCGPKVFLEVTPEEKAVPLGDAFYFTAYAYDESGIKYYTWDLGDAEYEDVWMRTGADLTSVERVYVGDGFKEVNLFVSDNLGAVVHVVDYVGVGVYPNATGFVDLEIRDLLSLPSLPQLNRYAAIGVNVANNGNQSSPPFRVRVEVSCDPDENIECQGEYAGTNGLVFSKEVDLQEGRANAVTQVDGGVWQPTVLGKYVVRVSVEPVGLFFFESDYKNNDAVFSLQVVEGSQLRSPMSGDEFPMPVLVALLLVLPAIAFAFGRRDAWT